MQLKPLLFRCASILSIASTIVIGAQSSEAQFGNYYCGTSDGLPTTIYQSPEGQKNPLIRWKTTLGQKWDPQTRCEEVSQRFIRFDGENTLAFLTTGTVRNMPVVCAVRQQGEICNDQYNSDRVLFTLPVGRNANEALEQLLGFASTIENGDPRSYYNGRTYVNVDKWILRNRRLYRR